MVSSSAIFACSDINETLDFYKNVLGFESTWTWGEPPTFGSVTSGGVTILMSKNPDLASHIRGHEHWIQVEDVDATYRRHVESGAKVVSEIEDKPWGFREYEVEDINGYHLRFCGRPPSSAEKSTALPAEVRIEQRLPTEDEYHRVTRSAFGERYMASGCLARTWKAVVALDGNGEAIGLVRIVYDAPQWFSIWDVAVMPEWQGRRIGETMMKAAIAMVKEDSPKAIISLFTFKHEFYARFGFQKETASLMRL